MFITFERVKELCQKQKISFNDLENKLEFGKNSLYGLKKSQPNSQIVTKIADYFDVSTDYLLGRTDNPNVANNIVEVDNKQFDVRKLAESAMTFDGKPLTDADKEAIQTIIEMYLRGR